jgi:hypothetical protein
MSKINSGILGPYSGTIGSVTGYRRNGKNIIQGKVKGQDLSKISSFSDNANTIHQLSKLIERSMRGIRRIETEFNCQFDSNPNNIIKYMKNAYTPGQYFNYRGLIINPEKSLPKVRITKSGSVNPNATEFNVIGARSGWNIGFWTHQQFFQYLSNSNAWSILSTGTISNNFNIDFSTAGIPVRQYRMRGVRYYNQAEPTKQVIIFGIIITQ